MTHFGTFILRSQKLCLFADVRNKHVALFYLPLKLMEDEKKKTRLVCSLIQDHVNSLENFFPVLSNQDNLSMHKYMRLKI